jgi:hypothetical protein
MSIPATKKTIQNKKSLQRICFRRTNSLKAGACSGDLLELNTPDLSDGTQVVQHAYSNVLETDKVKASEEQWADIFANYVAGNIDLRDPTGPGAAMNTFITGELAPYID